MSSSPGPMPEPIPADLRKALDGFRDEAEKIVKSFLDTLQSQPPPPVIYHYTNDVGLRGILESGRLWFTDVFNLNDPSELHHGLSHAASILSARTAGGPPESNAFAAYFASFERRGGLEAAGQYFICCLSEHGDDLGQWRAYGDNGRGYAIGFDAKALEGAFEKHGSAPHVRSFPIRYDDSELIDIHSKLVNSMFDLIFLTKGRNLKRSVENAYTAELATWLMVHALEAALHFKHEAYSNELEYRFLEFYPMHQPPKPPQPKSRVRRYSLIKYTEFDWKSVAGGALKKIVVGPAAEPEKAFRFAKESLRDFGMLGADVVGSKIPYRAV